NLLPVGGRQMAASGPRWRSCEALAQGISEVIDRVAGAVDGRLLEQEAVHLVVEVEVLDGHPGRAETLRVGASFVAQRVELRGDDQRRGQAAEIGGAQGEQVGVGAVEAVR